MQKLSTSSARFCSWIAVIVCSALVFTLAGVLAQGNPPRTSEPKSGVEGVQVFLKALFPELSAKNYVMSIEANGAFDLNWSRLSVLSVYIGRAERGHRDIVANVPIEKSVVEEKPILTGLFEFGQDGIIDSVNIHSPMILADEKNDAIRKLVDASRGWSDAKVMDALREAGAKFGPENRDLLMQNIPREALQPFTGPLQTESAEFHLRHDQSYPGSLALLYWEIDAVSTAPNGKRTHWSLLEEPFLRKITAIYRSLSDR